MTGSSSAATFVFVGTNNPLLPHADGKARGIAVYHINPTSGELALSSTLPGVINPSYLSLHPRNPWLYAVNGRDEGMVSAFRFDPQRGALTAMNQRSSHGPAPAHISIDHSGRWVLTATYATGHVTVARIQDDGSLGPVSASVQHEGQSVHPQRQTGPHPHYITVDPSNRFVLVADLGLDAILSYRFDQEAGTLTPHDPPALVLRPGAGPRHIAFHPHDRFAYVINELDSTIVACEYDATCGLLVPFQIESTLPSTFTGENTTAAIRVAPSGRFVYGSNRGHDSLASFAIDPESGRISFIEHVSTQGQTPRDFNIDPPGRFLLVANQESNTMVTLRIDQASGRLSPTGYVAEVLAPSCVAFGRWR